MKLNSTVREYYLMVKYDLEDGAPLEDIQMGLLDLEDNDDFVACAGVQMAIQEYLDKAKTNEDMEFDNMINTLINGEDKKED